MLSIVVQGGILVGFHVGEIMVEYEDFSIIIC